MAVTGTGTQGDPYIVHSYSELKTTIANIPNTLKYVKLGNDIDCNDYGSFEWETITPSATGAKFDLDLDGHTIKNIKIKASNYLISAPYYGNAKIHNGKILNVFCITGAYGILGENSTYNPFYIENVSMSIFIDNSVNHPLFYKWRATACAIYIAGESKSSNTSFKIMQADSFNDTGILADNCDFLFDLINLPPTPQIYIDNSNIVIKECRIRGKANFSNPSGFDFASPSQNSVWDLETNLVTSLSWANSTGGVYNSDKAHFQSDKGVIPVTSAEIINGNSLRAKGFVVVNVAG